MEIRVTVIQIFLLCFQTFAYSAAQEVVCKVPHINNGFVAAGRKKAQLSEGTRLPNGNDLGIYCNKGYKRSSDKRKPWIWCTKDGHWKRNVTCIGRQCNRIPVLKNGGYNSSGNDRPRYPYMLHAVCALGYKLQKPSRNSISCLRDSRWSRPRPVCREKNCSSPGQPEHGHYNATFGKFKDVIELMCDEGYELQTGGCMRCEATGIWSGNGVVCHAKECESLENITHGNYSIEEESKPVFEDTIQFKCQSGLRIYLGDIPVDTYNRTCLASRKWSGPEPQCQVVHVSAPSRSDVQTWTIAGIAVGAAFFVLTFIVVVVIFIRSRRDRDNSIDDNIKTPERGRRNISGITGNQRGMEMTGTGSTHLTTESESSETAIKRNSFADFVFHNQDSSDIMHAQFKAFPEGLQLTYHDAVTTKNRPKNRYKNVYPYDSTRVRLADIKGEPDSDFINASMIHGYSRINAYIATQGPTCSTTVDFWRMIWEQKASSIVMLTNLIELDKIKCHQYWPDNDSSNYGNITVTLTKTEVWPDFTVRCFQLRKKQNNKVKTVAVIRTVRQFHFTAWPDKCVPKFASSLVHLWSKVRLEQGTREKPIIVHCSAGIGRTGTFIALDWLVDQATRVDYIDVNGCVTTLRRQRLNMVKTLEQYKFLHHSLVEALMLSTRVVHVSEFPSVVKELLENDVTGQRTRMEQEFELLRMIGIDSQSTGNDADGKQHLVQLSGLSRNSCNTLWLSNYKGKNSFIVTQTPSQGSAANFWEMVLQHEVVTMVMLSNTPQEKEFWPEVCSPKKFGGIEVETKEVEAYSEYRTQTMVVRQGKKTVLVRQCQCMYWSDGQAVPSSPMPMLEQMQMVAAWQKAMINKPVLVHCQDGANRSGLYCVIASLIERLKSEHDVATSHTVDQLWRRKQDIIPNAEQFQFCHEALLAYIEKFEKASTDTENAIEKA